ncbi:butyrophilin subfamily 2 member A1-like isoform 2-T2 [Anableps anableps]
MILRVKKSSKKCLGGIVVLFLVSLEKVHGSHNVIGASQPVTAAPGDDVLLLCQVSSEWNATTMTVEWSRLDLLQNSSNRYVLVYRSRKVDTDQMMKSYVGRVFLGSGNASLKLTNVTVNDSGQYKCFLPSLKKFSVVQLVVAGNLSTSKPQNTTVGESNSNSYKRNWHPVAIIIVVAVVVAIIIVAAVVAIIIVAAVVAIIIVVVVCVCQKNKKKRRLNRSNSRHPGQIFGEDESSIPLSAVSCSSS